MKAERFIFAIGFACILLLLSAFLGATQYHPVNTDAESSSISSDSSSGATEDYPTTYSQPTPEPDDIESDYDTADQESV